MALPRFSSGATWRVELEGISSLQKALRALAEPDAPFLRKALEESGELLRGAAASRAPGGIGQKVSFGGIRGTVGGGLRAIVVIDHPGGRSMEFGRVWYYRGFKGHNQKSGHRFRAGDASFDLVKGRKGALVRKYRKGVGETGAGQKPRPYLGVKDGGHALAAVRDQVEQKLTDAVRKEWDRLAESH